jgi:uncharacterized protein (DUF1800 family)
MAQGKSFQAGSAAVSALLCALMAVPPAMLAEDPAAPKAGIPVETHLTALTQQEKVLHALNRLTFGLRPGDEAAVAKMGLERWFEQQLHPETIDDAALDLRLDAFPAMKLSQEQLLARFPSPGMLRTEQRKGGAMDASGDAAQRAIVADAEAAYAVKKMKQETAGAAGAADMAPVAGQDGMAGQNMAGQDAAAAQAKPMQDDGGAMNATAAAPAKKEKGIKYKVAAMDKEDADTVIALPPEQRMVRLVAMSPQEMLSFRAKLNPREKLQLMQGLAPVQMETVAAMAGEPVRVIGAETLESRLDRDVYSQRQLQAVMTDFWLNHFSVYVRKNQNEPYLLPEYQRDTILPNAMGNFETLLVATAKSPAMLTYLDNWLSIGPDSPAATRVKRVQQNNPNGKIAQALPKGINENYARELMELHTLGVGGGYTQADVIAVAKCFTGWTIDRKYQQGGSGEFVFEPNRHEGGDKVVLGHTIHEGGMNEGLEVLHILATSPATAKFVSTKLAVRFVSDTPSPALVNAMAATFLKTNGDIKAVLSTMFHSPEFWSPAVYRAKVKTPLEFMVSALRASDAQVKNSLPLVQAMDRLGMPIYGMQTPNGYSWKADEWVSSNALVSRMNFALVLSGSKVPGVQTNWPMLLGEGDSVAQAPTAATEKRLETLLLGDPAAARTREAVMAEFNNPTAQEQAAKSFAAVPAKGDMAGQGNGEMAGDGELLRAAYGKKGAGARGGDSFQAAGQAETPLDTMAGLLLGSPEFQRR